MFDDPRAEVRHRAAGYGLDESVMAKGHCTLLTEQREASMGLRLSTRSIARGTGRNHDIPFSSSVLWSTQEASKWCPAIHSNLNF